MFFPDLLLSALEKRQTWLTPPYERAFRLFNGYTEGLPGLRIEIFARTAVIFNLARPPERLSEPIRQAVNALPQHIPWLESILIKTRHAVDEEARRGERVWGTHLATRIRENGVRYALDLRLNQDASFYLDTRPLRAWLKANAAGRSILNTFAYTGSLGVSALAGGASRVLQSDLNRRFLNLAKQSCTLNGLPVHKPDYLAGDFFAVTARLRRAKARFDVVILDPPFFSHTRHGRVDLQKNARALLNKVRPLVAPGGWLVAVNNALYLSGTSFMEILEDICAQGVLCLDRIIPIPEDCTGEPYAPTGGAPYPEDPSPFNHPTKIALLKMAVDV